MAKFKYDDYRESAAVRDADRQLQSHKEEKPGDYQSRWQEELDRVLKKLQDREDFSYDPSADALYRQYRDQYARQGKLAMLDTVGQASALTGGYDNTYAQTVGQQVYQDHVSRLGERMPELYQAALEGDARQREALMEQYAMLGDREDTDYGRYRDQVEDYRAELDRLQSLYDSLSREDYDRYADDRNFQYGQYRDQQEDAQWEKEFREAARQWQEEMEYEAFRDRQEDARWEREFAEAMRQWQAEQDYEKSRDQVEDAQWEKRYGTVTARSSGSSKSSGSSSSSSKKKEEPALSEEESLANWIMEKAEWYNAFYPNVPIDSRTLDNWLYENGFGGESAAMFKENLAKLRGTTVRSR